MHFRFLTSTPLDIVRGSGTFAGISTLVKFLRKSGHTVDLVTPTFRFPIYTVERMVFNEMLRFRSQASNTVTVGFDMDGYSLAGTGRGFHVASIKGVIADEMRFETGLTRTTMRLQARCEKLHVQRAALLIAPSRYAASRIQELYSIRKPPSVIPEPIDLTNWRALLQLTPAQPLAGQPSEEKFVVLCVCRFYPRKRLHILLSAAARLRFKIPSLEVHIVGDGPEAARLKSICRKQGLEGIVRWLGNLSQPELAREYNSCHCFCLPSVQESFGIVFLEAMASGKPIIAARAASAPEVVKHGILVPPENDAALAEAIERLHNDAALREAIAAEGLDSVKQFDGPLIAQAFLDELDRAIRNQSTGRLNPIALPQNKRG